MNKILLLVWVPFFVFAKVHYAKVEPYESVVLKSAVSGLVIDVDLDSEGKTILAKRVIHIDDRLDKINLHDSKQSVILLKDMFKLNKNIAFTLQKSMQQKEEYYKRLSKLSTASKTQKDNAYSTFSAAKTQYFSTKEKIISLQKQILDMEYKVAQLEDSISKKSIIPQNKYIYKFLVNVGDFVAPGTPLVSLKDASRAKLVLFLEGEELEGIKEKTIFLEDEKTNYKVDKVWKVADEKFISSYRVELYLPAPKGIFSKLMKVEIK